MTEKIEKKCSKCQEVKPFEDFGKNRTRRDGYQSACTACSNEYYRQRYETNTAKALERNLKQGTKLRRATAQPSN